MSPPDDAGRIDTSIRALRERLLPVLRDKIPPDKLGKLQRADIAQFARDVSLQFFEQQQINLNALDQRDLITALINGYLASVGGNASAATVMRPE